MSAFGNNWTFAACPKTGTTSLARKLVEDYNGKIVGGHFRGRQIAKSREHHTFTLVRSPYTRIVSLWHSTVIATDRPYTTAKQRGGDPYGVVKGVGSKDFKSFALWMASYFTPSRVNILHSKSRLGAKDRILLTCSHYQTIMKSRVHFRYWFHLENLNEEIQVLPFWKKGDTLSHHLNTTVNLREHFWSYYDQDILDAVNKWGEPDFKKFKYTMVESIVDGDRLFADCGEVDKVFIRKFANQQAADNSDQQGDRVHQSGHLSDVGCDGVSDAVAEAGEPELVCDNQSAGAVQSAEEAEDSV